MLVECLQWETWELRELSNYFFFLHWDMCVCCFCCLIFSSLQMIQPISTLLTACWPWEIAKLPPKQRKGCRFEHGRWESLLWFKARDQKKGALWRHMKRVHCTLYLQVWGDFTRTHFKCNIIIEAWLQLMNYGIQSNFPFCSFPC